MSRVRRTSATLLAAALTTAGLLAVAPGTATAANEPHPVNGDSTVTIQGGGYGHGYGMSQYGAEGAARQGLTWKKIARFYYPGTKWGRAGGRVRILLTADTDRKVTVRAAKGLRVRRVANGRVWDLPSNGAARWRLVARNQGSQVQFDRGSGWRVWKNVGGEAEFRSRTGTVTLLAGSATPYRGALRLARPVDASGPKARVTVNVVGMQQYLRGVVPLEIPALWHPQAVSAQAVAARTYAARERADNRTRHYDLCDTTMCQVYGGAGAEHTASDAAIRRTKGHVLTYGGKPAFTQFSASNGGQAAQGSMPYLKAQVDPYDGWKGNPYHTWKVEFTDREIEKLWPQIGDLQRIVITQRDGNGRWGGRVLGARLVGANGRVDVSGSELRSTLGLRSNYLRISSVKPR
jgi:SpoIID/LytB domain protein